MNNHLEQLSAALRRGINPKEELLKVMQTMHEQSNSMENSSGAALTSLPAGAGMENSSGAALTSLPLQLLQK